ncbi:MAG: Mrp/NBP35 family ATP-binding protein [Candidatus Margulisbacteria bacterium]|nr:Mrp/NBP35 family ATP-binding protein [Candidatus Margulisiibacteriota bacterium]
MQQQLDQAIEKEQIKEVMDKIKHKIMIMSNKGGVGKSTITVNIARTFAEKGNTVGVLDIDIHGPSQAKMFGFDGQNIKINGDKKIVPFNISDHLKLVTVAGFLEKEDQPLIWRGPLKISLIKQFIRDVDWGELDYLVIDAPPGTGDEPLTIGQLVPDMDGVIIVTTPQDIALLDSKKAINFVKQLELPVLGLIENMSGLKCPHCGENIDLFKTDGGKRAAEEMSVDVLGVLPFNQALFHSSESGTFINDEKVETTNIFKEIVMNLENKIK